MYTPGGVRQYSKLLVSFPSYVNQMDAPSIKHLFDSRSRVRAVPAKLLIEVLNQHGDDVSYTDSPVILHTSALAKTYGIHLLRTSLRQLGRTYYQRRKDYSK